jgi:DNA invertase Pin-like site-specific DNA recombinase
MSKKLIAYLRVSTERQQSSRNGLEAQKDEIATFARLHGYEVIEYVEEGVSGKYDLVDRPILKEAIKKCLKMKATLIVSKLDRLSRRASFIMNLMETKLKFVVAELGEDISPFMIHIHCVVSEHERHTIGLRTKVALQAKKRREPEWKPGNPTNLKEAGLKGARATAKEADTFAERLRPGIQRMKASGMTLYAIAKELNEQETKTARGGVWTTQSVSNLARRLGLLSGKAGGAHSLGMAH